MPNTALEAHSDSLSDVSEIRSVSEIQAALAEVALEQAALHSELAAVRSPEPAYSVQDPLEGDVLSSSGRRRSEHPSAYDAIAFVEGPRVLTITWLPPAPTAG